MIAEQIVIFLGAEAYSFSMPKMHVTKTVVLKQADILDPFGVISVDKSGWGAGYVPKCGCDPDRFFVIAGNFQDIRGSNQPILVVFCCILQGISNRLSRLKLTVGFDGRRGDKGCGRGKQRGCGRKKWRG